VSATPAAHIYKPRKQAPTSELAPRRKTEVAVAPHRQRQLAGQSTVCTVAAREQARPVPEFSEQNETMKSNRSLGNRTYSKFIVVRSGAGCGKDMAREHQLARCTVVRKTDADLWVGEFI